MTVLYSCPSSVCVRLFVNITFVLLVVEHIA